MEGGRGREEERAREGERGQRERSRWRKTVFKLFQLAKMAKPS